MELKTILHIPFDLWYTQKKKIAQLYRYEKLKKKTVNVKSLFTEQMDYTILFLQKKKSEVY